MLCARLLPRFVLSRRTMITKAVAQCFIYVAIATMGLAVKAPGFKVAKKYPVPGDGGFD